MRKNKTKCETKKYENKFANQNNLTIFASLNLTNHIMITTLTIEGIDLEITYDFEPYEAQTLEHQGQEGGLVIEEISVNGVGIFPLISNRIFDEIEKYISNQ